MWWLYRYFFVAIWLGTLFAQGTNEHLDRLAFPRSDSDVIRDFGTCALGEGLNKQLLRPPRHPLPVVFYQDILRPISRPATRFNAQQAWWIVDQSPSKAPSLIWIKEDRLSSADKIVRSVDHVYEKNILKEFFNHIFSQRQLETCAHFKEIFVDTADQTWVNPAVYFVPNVKDQSRLQSLWNLLPNKLNLAFVGMDRVVNQVKGVLFNENLSGYAAPQPNTRVRDPSLNLYATKNLNNWAKMGMAIQYLNLPVVQQQYQLVSSAIMGGLNQLDVLWSTCNSPAPPLNLGPRYRQWMATLLSTNIASASSLVSEYSNSLVRHAITEDSNGNKNNLYTSFSHLSKSYPPHLMTFPLAIYATFPDTTNGNIRRDAPATACPARITTQPSPSSTMLIPVTTVRRYTTSHAGFSLPTTLSKIPTSRASSGPTREVITAEGSSTPLPATSPATTSRGAVTQSLCTLIHNPSPGCLCNGCADIVPTMTGSTPCNYTSPPCPASATSSQSSMVATVTLGQIPVVIGVQSNLPALAKAVASALHSACPPPSNAGDMTSCTTDSAVVPGVTWVSETGLMHNGELELDLESSGYDTVEMLDNFINSTVTSMFASASKLNCMKVAYQDLTAETGVDGQHVTLHKIGKAIECASTSAVTITTAITGLGFGTVVKFAEKQVSQFFCKLVVSGVQAGLDVITTGPELPIGGQVLGAGGNFAISKFAACCEGTCESPLGIVKSLGGQLAPHVSTMVGPLISALPIPLGAGVHHARPIGPEHGNHAREA